MKQRQGKPEEREMFNTVFEVLSTQHLA